MISPENLPVLAILPAGKFFDEVFAIIERISKQSGLTAKRLEFSATIEIPDRNPMTAGAEARLVVADLTGLSPFVFYQIGRLQRLNLPFLLLTDHLEKVAFIKSENPIIAHAGNAAILEAQLKTELIRALHPVPDGEGGAESNGEAAKMFRQLFGEILQRHSYDRPDNVHLENPTTFVIEDQEMGLALVQDLARRSKELGYRLKLL